MIRPATADDVPQLSALHRRSIRALCGSDYSPGQIDAWTQIITDDAYAKLLAMPAVVALVDASQEEILGIGVATPAGGLVNAIYVDPTHARRGVGRALLSALEDELRVRGVTEVRLNATINAVGFYTAAGYRDDGDAVNELPSGVKLPCRAMSRALR